ncbi:NADPH:quinone reductase-like Zn-dependent oxidoreductase [Oceanisphaera litoralis]|uniref:zinc-dependent alcohol dehydrogenase family protein n=1 Tax=Oceanisphaera litoralis TaxID=225144 RepID=UPI00195F0C1A|nr:NAD(P)-dependent alcohol dehydrogenase [Oceanisphaera litoralis]MBM7454604.1 NADPH:quinone reductase-like Zn-dependent oxidoreductase [Oceanisphaera litoralis]
MKAYRISHGGKIDGLRLEDIVERPLEPYEVRVKVRAVSLNYRDLMVANGAYPVKIDIPVIPCSDGAGDVIAVGSMVSRVQPGDRVAASFFPDWFEGRPAQAKVRSALGGDVDGMLAEEVTLHEETLVKIPDQLSYVEASTLPCAGVTAWNAIFESSDVWPGDTVLLLGTGGVSILGLQMAKAAGLRAIITSSSDEKLVQARALGADETINYRTTPEWQDEVLRLTGGEGVDVVLEVGGQGTITRSVASTAVGGSIAVIGGVSGFGGEVNPFSLALSARRMVGIYVGSRAMLEQTVKLVAGAGIKPVVDRVFPFAEAKEAYRYLESGAHFGKVVIELTQ